MSDVLKNTNKQDPKYKWDLSHMYADDEKWEADFAWIKQRLPSLSSFKGELKKLMNIVCCFDVVDSLSKTLEKLVVYAHCKRDEDTKSDKYNAMFGRAMTLYSEFTENIAFVEPELSALDADKLKSFSENPKLADHKYTLETIIKSKPHILSPEEEKLLALTNDFTGDFENIFTMIDNADLEFPTVDIDGVSTKLTHGAYSLALQHRDQATRKRSFEAYYNAYKKHINTIAANYSGEVKKNIFFSKARKYTSYLDKAMDVEDVPRVVYEKLIESVDKSLPKLHQYIHYRKQQLKVDDLYMHDLYVPIVEGANLSLTYEDSCDLVLKALAPLGDEYLAKIKEGYKNAWIDVFESDSKRSGGYCIHAYLAPHPYVLLNYCGTTHDIFTLAHELGHAMHSYLSGKNQPFSKANYKIFVAEVASTVNEMILIDYLLKNTKDVKLKKYLLSYKLDAMRTTIFRQTMFSEFELYTHTQVESGNTLTVKSLSAAYDKLNTKYYGDAITHDEFIQFEWARIPHFYRSFYVYKYATGLIAAINIAEKICAGDKEALSQYMKFLSSGGSKSPYEILCDAGVDLAETESYDRAMKVFEKTMAELKKL